MFLIFKEVRGEVKVFILLRLAGVLLSDFTFLDINVTPFSFNITNYKIKSLNIFFSLI